MEAYIFSGMAAQSILAQGETWDDHHHHTNRNNKSRATLSKGGISILHTIRFQLRLWISSVHTTSWGLRLRDVPLIFLWFRWFGWSQSVTELTPAALTRKMIWTIQMLDCNELKAAFAHLCRLVHKHWWSKEKQKSHCYSDNYSSPIACICTLRDGWYIDPQILYEKPTMMVCNPSPGWPGHHVFGLLLTKCSAFPLNIWDGFDHPWFMGDVVSPLTAHALCDSFFLRSTPSDLFDCMAVIALKGKLAAIRGLPFLSACIRGFHFVWT